MLVEVFGSLAMSSVILNFILGYFNAMLGPLCKIDTIVSNLKKYNNLAD
jgi:hypothetical protein